MSAGKTRTQKTVLLVAAVLCIPMLGLGCGVVILPLATITSTQLANQPNFTVEFSIASAVSNPAGVTNVNWVFGDAPGFTSGGVTIQHRYTSGGTYNIVAYVFGANGLVGQINGTTTVVVPDKATEPSPANSATGVAVSVTLSWSAGNGTPEHDVYLGTSLTAVTSATRASAEFRATRSVTNFTPSGLVGSTVYFWRVDEVRATGTTKGDVWSFTTATAPGQAADLTPVDGETGVAVLPQFSWTAGSNTTSHDVYLGTDSNAVDAADRNAAEFRGNQSGTTFSPSALDPNTQYFWRIDEVGPGGTTKGVVQSFTTSPTPSKATNFAPADMATGVAIDVTLSWTAGTNADSHDVYFGTSQTNVNAATRSTSGIFRGNQTAATSQPADLDANTTYFWRIDEVGPGGTTKGDVLRFTTADVPDQVTAPDPAISEQGVSLNPTLMWTTGADTASFDVYFGESQTAVDNATTASAEFMGNQAGTSFTPTGPLTDNRQFFWRIDSKGPGGTTKGSLFNFTTQNNKAARDPTPANEAENIGLAQVLSWTAGDGAVTHDVYFGTDQTAVTNATTASAEFQGNFPGTSFAPALVADTTYYWRIDEVDAMPATTKGLTWRFKTLLTPPDAATNPSPANAATDVATTLTLSWTAGARATSHDVYFGTDQTAVTNATTASAEYRGNRPTTTYNLASLFPSGLARNTQYYWRIDEKNTAGTTAGTVWSFTTLPDAPTKATMPSPADAATNQNVNSDPAIPLSLGWTAGTNATSHDVYFGTNQTTVTNATTATAGIFRGNQAGVSFDPGSLTAGTQYFWRIDEKNSGGTTKGDVWSFTTFSPAPDQASAPMPANNNQSANNTPTLSWTAGTNTTSFNVYFGTSQSAVDAATRSSPEFAGNQAVGDTDYAPGTLAAGTAFFWRIDAVGAGGVTKGVTWRFTTPP